MRLARPLIFLLPLAACGGGSGAECLALPCPEPVAIALTISSSVAGASAPVARVEVDGAVRTSRSCSGSCQILGPAGTYHVAVSAPGFTPVERSVVVRGESPACGCPSTVVENVAIALVPAPPALRADRGTAS